MINFYDNNYSKINIEEKNEAINSKRITG